MLITQITMPQAGQITSITAYFAGKSGGGSITARVAVWDGTGSNPHTLLAQSGDLSVAAGNGTVGGQAYQTGTLTTPYNAFNGQVLWIGWWVHSSQPFEWTEDTGNSEQQAADGSNTAPGNETFSAFSGQPGIYATYTPSEAWANQGTPAAPNWVAGSVLINTGTPAAPVWTTASQVAANTGTPASPVWTPGL